jgi:hypothetical protein
VKIHNHNRSPLEIARGVNQSSVRGSGDKDDSTVFNAVGNEVASLHPQAQKSSRRICTCIGYRGRVAYSGNHCKAGDKLTTVDHAAYSVPKGRSESQFQPAVINFSRADLSFGRQKELLAADESTRPRE